jgi:hypothetical protein
VPEAVATSARGPARFDPGATPIGVVCHAVVLGVGKSILLALACSFHSEVRLLLRSVSAVYIVSSQNTGIDCQQRMV